ncbi:Clp protease ClpP [Clostridium tyrobutyricum]|uniref:ATP-dependent Clp protease proteolytic subunit n=1 Tax=Clostridium tyrobutyricum DIVETGP TaxID=1408889 RepID=W6NKU8_CLOTY|nr:head maturation protease, ClpP-related [Clostridium tyrobutyricum]AND85570.1 ATP-dependent Clp protease proteolytic subunit [Clostridium tyrobutyricum]ANP70100.1 peptidase [Clostridium tyrobutyricum]MBV4433755.1 Clp protease ClpP [Clostridium tyrobutyricum]QNB65539.1 Clp protease ClpP [Clostridium tyrobutyricum]CDL92472.1 Prophage Clp protease-like protein [Clostridium tyrobutyricum DIVETGP]
MSKGKKFWTFNAKENSNEGELLLYGDISDSTWWGDEVTPKNFKEELDLLGDIKTLNVYINSGGGDVFAGQAIYSMLKRHSAAVNVYVDGLAASIASIIAMAGDNVKMPKNAMIMVHNPWSFAMGNAKDFRKLADDLDKVRESMISVYEDKTGMEKESIVELLDAETWMTAEEAVEFGFADEIEEEKQVAASLNNRIFDINGLEVDITRYKNLQVSKIQFREPMLHENQANKPKENHVDIEEVKEKDINDNKIPTAKDEKQVPIDLYKKLNEIHERRFNI